MELHVLIWKSTLITIILNLENIKTVLAIDQNIEQHQSNNNISPVTFVKSKQSNSEEDCVPSH